MHVPKALDVVTLGEAMALFVAEQAGPLEAVQNFKRMTAGAELNVAVGLSRLGLRVGYVSRVGADSFGKFLLNFLDAEKIDRSHVTVDRDHPTGFMLKSLADVGSDPIIEYHRKGSAASCLALHDNPADYFSLSKHLHLTGIAPALSKPTLELTFQMAVEARSQGRSVSFDPNLRPRLWSSQKHMVETINRLAQQADLVLPGRGLKVPQVIDTVGAGDGFAVGVISAILEGQSLEEATRRGNSIGARVVQYPGDCDGLPRRGSLDTL
jgi:2-dehydro-3-deoxygluconokinase